MLTAQSYLVAWLVYSGALLVGLLILHGWLRRRISATALHTLLLLLAGLALAPAHPEEAPTIWAPALIVLPFDFLTLGADAASSALRSILAMLGLALVASLIVYLGRRLLGRAS